MLVSITNAPAIIGHINPGLCYWWTKTNGQWFMWLPDPITLAQCSPWQRWSVIWPGLVFGCWAAFVYIFWDWSKIRAAARLNRSVYDANK